MMLFRLLVKISVRKTDDVSNRWIVANGPNSIGSSNYISSKGRIQPLIDNGIDDYATKTDAQTALDLYLEEQKAQDHTSLEPFGGGLEVKDTNPKDALGIKKAPLHSVPTGPLFEVGLAFLEGARKYGSHNYREVGVRASVYYDAVMRHIMAWWEGEDVDPDSGVPHIIKAMASLFVLRDSMLMGNCIDDRPIKYPTGLEFSILNQKAAEIIEKYPNCVTPFLEKDIKCSDS